jgi:hypothetical protein
MTTIANMQEVNGQTLKLYNAGVEGSELFRCLAKYNSQTYVGTAEATDIHDPFYIDIGRSIPTQGVNVGQTLPTTQRSMSARQASCQQAGHSSSRLPTTTATPLPT